MKNYDHVPGMRLNLGSEFSVVTSFNGAQDEYLIAFDLDVGCQRRYGCARQQCRQEWAHVYP